MRSHCVTQCFPCSVSLPCCALPCATCVSICAHTVSRSVSLAAFPCLALPCTASARVSMCARPNSNGQTVTVYLLTLLTSFFFIQCFSAQNSTEHRISTPSLLMPRCYLTYLAHKKSCKELSPRAQLGLASGPPALLTRKTVCPQFTAMAESRRVYLYLQGIRMNMRSLTLRGM